MIDRVIQEVPIGDIVRPKQIRESFPAKKIAQMAGSAKEHGILHAVLAHREGNSIVLDDGELRGRAAELAGLSTVPAVIEDRELSVAQVIQRQLVANCQRVDLSPVEKAKAIDRLSQETGWSNAEVSRKLGMSPAQVSKLLCLLLLPPDIQGQVASGKLAASTAYEIAKVSDTGERNRLAAQAANGGLTRDKAAALTRALAKSAKPRPRRHRDRVVFPLGDGRSLAVSGSGLNLDWLLTSIEHLLRRLRDASAGGLALPDVIKSLSGK